MKNKKILLIIKIAIPIIILGGSFEIERYISARVEKFSNNIVIVNEDNSALGEDDKPLEIVNRQSYGNVEGFSENFGFIGDDEALVGIGLSQEEFYKKYPNEFDTSNEKDDKLFDEANDDIYGNIYRLKLSTLEKKPLPLGIEVNSLWSDLELNVNKITYIKDNNYLIYDLKNDSSTVYKKASDVKEDIGNVEGNWSKDGSYIISYDDGDLDLYNVKEKSSKKLKVKSDNLWIGITPGFYSENGENIYFIGTQNKNNDSRYQRTGIFKINSSSQKIEEVLVLPYRDTQSSDYSKESGIPSNDYSVLEEGKKIILNATIEGKDGTYIYDVDSKKFYNVIPHVNTDAEGSYCSSIWVSPDKTKVVYINKESEDGKDQWNLYAAKINGNSLTSKICIYKGINFPRTISNAVQWSGDSKKILFFSGSEKIEKNNFVFTDKNEVNIITFK
ncbi:hypothetical protein [Clostridium sp. BL-8]|uniref:hypothetical protein n=1 Tax=Clostridium sp. BL-8 TaxID=349938 RepID=UPI00098C0C7A|nr:hypothetical protein [Clostridium sp. BL-8]OOM76505.1 hypothetical protein CLOBL_35620 [Clostridium sp. BL-8]